MKTKNILKAVVYMNQVDQQGIIEYLFEENGTFESQLEKYFGEIDWNRSIVNEPEFDTPYYYSYIDALCDGVDRGGELEVDGGILYLVNGEEVYLYKMEG